MQTKVDIRDYRMSARANNLSLAAEADYTGALVMTSRSKILENALGWAQPPSNAGQAGTMPMADAEH